jgi:phenylalanyl-tRNA synthetase beta chain
MYNARIIKDVVIGESPSFIKNRLGRAGMRSINNIVDISNYIMLEYGQPLHFFDKDKVGSIINVRMANEGEMTTTLDGKTRSLIKEDIVIANDKDIIAIAGVMGCANSEIDNNTKNLVIESAIFNPYNVRYTSIRLDLRSEASIRIEKILNYEYTKEAIDRACYLLEKYATGKVMSGVITYDKIDKTPKVAVVSRDKINAVLGMNLTHEDIMNAFNKLAFKVDAQDETYTVVIPNRRMDVSIREDLIEEVGCLYGYDNIVGKLPTSPMKSGGYNDKTSFRKQISKRMRTLGLDEARTYTLISKEESSLFNYQNRENISLQLPMSNDRGIIRQSILPSLIKTVEYNMARSVKDIAIYEISNVYGKTNNNYYEDTKLAFAMLGNYINNKWQNNSITIDFYVVKGIIENLLTYLGFTDRYTIKAGTNLPKEIHPGISAEVVIDNEIVGYFGAIHPSLNKLPLFVGELNLNAMYAKKTGKIKYREGSKFPSIVKDMAFILDKKILVADIIKIIKTVGGRTLDSIDVFDVYAGPNVDDDKQSIAFSLTFTDINKTLTDEEINAIFNNIIKEIETKLNGILRNK